MGFFLVVFFSVEYLLKSNCIVNIDSLSEFYCSFIVAPHSGECYTAS